MMTPPDDQLDASRINDSYEDKYLNTPFGGKKVRAFFINNPMPPKAGEHNRCPDLLNSFTIAGHQVTRLSHGCHYQEKAENRGQSLHNGPHPFVSSVDPVAGRSRLKYVIHFRGGF